MSVAESLKHLITCDYKGKSFKIEVLKELLTKHKPEDILAALQSYDESPETTLESRPGLPRHQNT